MLECGCMAATTARAMPPAPAVAAGKVESELGSNSGSPQAERTMSCTPSCSLRCTCNCRARGAGQCGSEPSSADCGSAMPGDSETLSRVRHNLHAMNMTAENKITAPMAQLAVMMMIEGSEVAPEDVSTLLLKLGVSLMLGVREAIAMNAAGATIAPRSESAES